MNQQQLTRILRQLDPHENVRGEGDLNQQDKETVFMAVMIRLLFEIEQHLGNIADHMPSVQQ